MAALPSIFHASFNGIELYLAQPCNFTQNRPETFFRLLLYLHNMRRVSRVHFRAQCFLQSEKKHCLHSNIVVFCAALKSITGKHCAEVVQEQQQPQKCSSASKCQSLDRLLKDGPHKIGKVARLKSRRYYSSPNFETFFEAEQKMHEFTPPDRIIFKIWGMWLIAFHSSFYITVIA